MLDYILNNPHYLVEGLVAILVAVIVIRALAFKPKKQNLPPREELTFDKDAAVSALQQLVQCKTISCNDPAMEDEQEFRKLIDLLPKLYPNVFSACSFREMPDRGLLFCWPGKKKTVPSVMMAHYDVVSVNEESWAKPPFAGIIEDGVLWGRGTLDTKATLNGVLSAANHLIAEQNMG